MTPFIVFAMPRARSAWLAQFLSSGYGLCIHDALGRFANVPELVDWLTHDPARYHGISDTAAVMAAGELRQYLPMAARAVILRDPVEVARSLHRFLPPGAPRREIVSQMDALYQRLIDLSDQPDVMRLHASDLDDADAVFALWTHLMPDEPFDLERYEEMHMMSIEVMLERAAMHYAPVLRARALGWYH